MEAVVEEIFQDGVEAGREEGREEGVKPSSFISLPAVIPWRKFME